MARFEDQARSEGLPAASYNELAKALAADFHAIERRHRRLMEKLVDDATTLPWLEVSEEEHCASVIPFRYPATDAAEVARSDATWSELGA